MGSMEFRMSNKDNLYSGKKKSLFRQGWWNSAQSIWVTIQPSNP